MVLRNATFSRHFWGDSKQRISNVSRRVSEDILTEGKWCPQVTPASYLHLLQEFRALFTARQTQVTAVKKKYLSGLDKLAFAASQVGAQGCPLGGFAWVSDNGRKTNAYTVLVNALLIKSSSSYMYR